jgi:hypothetical protein
MLILKASLSNFKSGKKNSFFFFFFFFGASIFSFVAPTSCVFFSVGLSFPNLKYLKRQAYFVRKDVHFLCFLHLVPNSSYLLIIE